MWCLLTKMFSFSRWKFPCRLINLLLQIILYLITNLGAWVRMPYLRLRRSCGPHLFAIQYVTQRQQLKLKLGLLDPVHHERTVINPPNSSHFDQVNNLELVQLVARDHRWSKLHQPNAHVPSLVVSRFVTGPRKEPNWPWTMVLDPP